MASDRPGRGVLLQTAPLPAGTGATPDLDNPMAHLGGILEVSVQKPAIENDTRAHAGPQGQEDHVAYVAARADPELAPCGCVGVVYQRDGLASQLRHSRAQRHVMPAGQVGRRYHYPRARVHESRAPHAHRRDAFGLDIRLLDDALDQPRHARDDMVGSALYLRGD